MTFKQLSRAMPGAGPRLGLYGLALLEAMEAAQINNALRQAHFLAQIGHESGDLAHVVENLNYSAASLVATWPKRFNAETAAQYARQPERIANRVYANRMGNGDEASGDGWRFRGRGLIQLTGRANYTAFAQDHGADVVNDPDLLATDPRLCVAAAAWFWTEARLNDLADDGPHAVAAITSKINGGDKGLLDRQARFARAYEITNAYQEQETA